MINRARIQARNLFLAFMCLFFCTLSASSWHKPADDAFPYIHQLVSTSIYPGDMDGEFKGDFVAELDDGSAWKVHPDHAQLYSTWQPGENVHIAPRTTSYWFKREHKCMICNLDRKESVFVMPVRTPWYIDYTQRPHYTTIVYGSYGSVSYTDWRRNISLDSSEHFEVDCNAGDKHYEFETPAYVAYREDNGMIIFYVISGVGKHSVWGRARTGHYTYY